MKNGMWGLCVCVMLGAYSASAQGSFIYHKGRAKNNAVSAYLTGMAYFWGNKTGEVKDRRVIYPVTMLEWNGMAKDLPPKNLNYAKQYLVHATKLRDLRAMATVGNFHLRRVHGMNSPKTGLSLLMTAAQNGLPHAMQSLAYAYGKGGAIGFDPVKNLGWTILAARKGHPVADIQVTELALSGDISDAGRNRAYAMAEAFAKKYGL